MRSRPTFKNNLIAPFRLLRKVVDNTKLADFSPSASPAD